MKENKMKIRIEKDTDGFDRIYDDQGNELETTSKPKSDYEIWDVYVSDQGLMRGFYVGEWYRSTNTLNVTNLQLEILR